MNNILKYLTDNPTFYVATMDGDQPRVRPFGAVCTFENRLYICTNNTKAVYRQMLANPKIEISTTGSNTEWIRITANAVRDDRDEARKAMLEACPMLQNMYKYNDGLYEVFYLKDATAVISSFDGTSRKITF